MKAIIKFRDLLPKELYQKIEMLVYDYFKENNLSSIWIHDGYVEISDDTKISATDIHVVTYDIIENTLMSFYQTSPDIIYRRSRERRIIEIRQQIQFFLYVYSTTTLASIGYGTGKYDHATVLHSCKTVINLGQTNKSYLRNLLHVDRMILNKLDIDVSKIYDPVKDSVYDWGTIQYRR